MSSLIVDVHNRLQTANSVPHTVLSYIGGSPVIQCHTCENECCVNSEVVQEAAKASYITVHPYDWMVDHTVDLTVSFQSVKDMRL